MARKPRRDLTVTEQLARGPVDLPFLMLTMLLLGIGLIMVLSASYATAYYSAKIKSPMFYFIRQTLFAILGVICMYIASKFNYQRLRGLSVPLLGLALILLVLVLLVGTVSNGAKRWIYIGPISFQPSEVAKLAVVLYFSAKLSKRNPNKHRKWNRRTTLGRILQKLDNIGFLELVPYGAILLIIALLMIKEPHMSGTILILAGGASILFAAGIKLYWFILGLGGGGAVLALIISKTDYMASRVALWKDPWIDARGKGYQTIQSLYAIGSGGLLGLGLGKSRQKFLYLPEPENDFIFSIVAEEMGYIGAAIVLILFALLIIRGYWLAIHARDRFGALLVVGITTLLAVQVFLNIAVVTNLIPVTGISLPFFSYGGTALVIQLVEMGVILSVSRQIPAPKAE